MKCANCGAEIKLGCVYCSVCGKEAQIVPDYNVEEDILKELLEEDDKPNKNASSNGKKKKSLKNSTIARSRLALCSYSCQVQ